MNPQNMGTHISDRHSLLWRKKMFEEPKVPSMQVCHTQLNEWQMGQSWRSRNNFIKTNFSQFKDRDSLRKATRSVVIENLLAEQKMQTNSTKGMLKSIAIDVEALQKSQKLIEGMHQLKEMKLLNAKDLQKTKYPGTIRHQHIYNDYHVKQTNPGYSRNYMGKFYTK